MASTYSPNLRIELIGNGEQSNTWGTTTNTNLGTLIEQAISGLVSVDVTAGNVTLTTLNGASDQSRQMIIVATGTPGVTRTITAPAVNKVYIVYNNSNATLSFIASGGTGVSLSVGARKLVYCDGTNFVEAINSVAITSGSIDGVAIGATTASTGAFTTLEYTSTLTGGTGVVNIGTSQIYKDASGNIGIGATAIAGISLLLQKSLTGSTDAAQLYNSPTILSGVTSTASLFVTSPSTQAAAFALASLTHYNTSFNTKGAGSSITNQYGFSATSGLTSATNNYAFTGNLAAATGRYNLYMAGTADNYIAGSLGIGATTVAGVNVLVQKSLTGYADAVQIYNNPTILSDVTSTTSLFTTAPSTQAAAFTLVSLTHYNTSFNVKGAGSAITNQYGFSATSGLTTATNNYSFTGNLAAATGRYNLYMAGTADNYLGGSLGIGGVPAAGQTLFVNKNITGATSTSGIAITTSIQSDVTGQTALFSTYVLTQAAAFTLSSLKHYNANQGTFGVGSTVTGQYGFFVDASLTSATNNYGFYGNIAAATGRYNLYMAGTADNYLAGNVGIGAVPAAGQILTVSKNMSGATSSYGVGAFTTVLSDVTSSASGFSTFIGTQAVAFTLSNLKHYSASQGTIGAGSTVTNQYGFNAESNLTGATNNYGFYGNIPAATGRYNLYMSGTADNYLAGKLTVANSITISGAFALRGSYGAGAIASNFAAGDNALVSNTTGANNSAVGVQTLQSNTTGTGNSAMGVVALQLNTTGANNSAVGVQALLSNTTGASNSAVGVSALQSNTTGSNNSAIGLQALLSNTTGTNNSAIGVSALQDLATTTIVATAIVNGTAYQIVTMGTTTSAQWIASGAVTGKVGETFTANATAGVGTGTVATSANIATQCLNNTALGKASGRGITTGSGNTILGANVTGLAAGLTNNVIIANGTGSIRVQSNATTITFADVILPPQAVTASAPAYVKGGMYFDTTLNKMRIGGATAWETVTSI